MRTAICLIAFVLIKTSEQGGLSESSSNFAALIMTVCMIMDIVDFILNFIHKTK